ncbi:MAG TPA: hypothetical protein VFU76_11290 [Terriglobales bacterium]|nr:hypothetical protein [Terriglobales bacterium]
MRPIKRIFVLAILAVAILLGWRVGVAELANYNLQGDLHDLASAQSSFRFGNVSHSDDDVRAAIIAKARDQGIVLQPDQVTVQHTEDRYNSPLYLSAKYDVPVQVGDYSFVLHFKPTSSEGSF